MVNDFYYCLLKKKHSHHKHPTWMVEWSNHTQPHTTISLSFIIIIYHYSRMCIFPAILLEELPLPPTEFGQLSNLMILRIYGNKPISYTERGGLSYCRICIFKKIITCTIQTDFMHRHTVSCPLKQWFHRFHPYRTWMLVLLLSFVTDHLQQCCCIHHTLSVVFHQAIGLQ